MNVRRSTTTLSVVIGALVVVSSCADGSGTSPANDSSVETSIESTGAATSDTVAISSPVTPVSSPPDGSTPVSSEQIDPGLQPFIDIAIDDLAKRLSIDAKNVGVTSATLVEWPDGSLGCPQPDQQYTQVSTDGSLIVLTAANGTYRYHAGGSRTPFLCEPTSKPTPITGLTTP
jgi:hypothetical protein